MSKIEIKPSHKGNFTDYCNGKVTLDCINKGKRSTEERIRKMAVFAENSRKWKHEDGGLLLEVQRVNNLAVKLKAKVQGTTIKDGDGNLVKVPKEISIDLAAGRLPFYYRGTKYYLKGDGTCTSEDLIERVRKAAAGSPLYNTASLDNSQYYSNLDSNNSSEYYNTVKNPDYSNIETVMPELYTPAVYSSSDASTSITSVSNDYSGFRTFGSGRTTGTLSPMTAGGAGSKVTAGEIYNALTAKGVGPKAAAAIAGNLMHESGGNLHVPGDNGTSFGLAQWHNNRKDNLFAYTGTENPTMSLQIDFLLHEINTQPEYRGLLNQLENSESVDAATELFMNKFERPKAESAHLESRQKYARGLTV